MSEAEAAAFLAILDGGATIVDDPAEQPSLRTAGLHDGYLVALAEAARAGIVSGDRHLLGLAGQLPVCAPAGFLHLVSDQERE